MPTGKVKTEVIDSPYFVLVNLVYFLYIGNVVVPGGKILSPEVAASSILGVPGLAVQKTYI